MKALKDLGTEHWEQLDPDNVNITIEYTLEERREFARRVYKIAQEELVVSSDGSRWLETDFEIDEFLKREEL
jgi:hypothetical protein